MEESENNDQPTQFISDPPSSRKKIFIPIAAILVIVIGALMAVKASVHKEARLASHPVELLEGSEVPNFDLIKIDGTKVQISDLPHKVMMINFWATWCEACMEEMPSLIALRDQYSPKGFEVLGVNVEMTKTAGTFRHGRNEASEEQVEKRVKKAGTTREKLPIQKV